MYVFFFSLGSKWIGVAFKEVNNSNILLALGISVFSGVVAVPQTLMRLRQNAIRLVFVNVVFYMFGVIIGIILLIQFGLGASGLLIGTLVTSAISVIPYILNIRSDLVAKFSVQIAYQSLVLSLPIVAHMLSHWGLNLMDRLILQAYLPLADVGIYQLGYQFGTVFQIIVIAVNSAWTPYFMEHINQKDQLYNLKRLSTWLVFIQIWIAFALVLLLPTIVRWVIPQQYHASTNVIIWIVLGFLSVSFYQFWVNIIFYHKRTAVVPLATLVAACSNLILNLTLIPHFGYLIAAINTMISYIILAVITFIIAWKIQHFPFEYSRWIKAGSVAVGLYTFAMIVSKIDVRFITPINIVVILLFPFVLNWVSFWNINEKHMLQSWINKLAR